ncbi:hypothetical protein DFH08DRAFT_933732 [Mycena albidolilacea]|uniref:Uncharacterized protein n=1 Tax=Mycena albidolilacea TaxID=1033008 RepID=A0AAD7AC57_9AGAR|nr:hypothetical protein DFH08DRAFT_933732 [Mycena albidolilacea]
MALEEIVKYVPEWYHVDFVRAAIRKAAADAGRSGWMRVGDGKSVVGGVRGQGEGGEAREAQQRQARWLRDSWQMKINAAWETQRNVSEREETAGGTGAGGVQRSAARRVPGMRGDAARQSIRAGMRRRGEGARADTEFSGRQTRGVQEVQRWGGRMRAWQQDGGAAVRHSGGSDGEAKRHSGEMVAACSATVGGLPAENGLGVVGSRSSPLREVTSKYASRVLKVARRRRAQMEVQ